MYALSSWAEYFRLHAIVISLGGRADLPTLQRLCRGCTDVGLSRDAIADVTANLYGHETVQIGRALQLLRESHLRYLFLADCYRIARAAHIATPEYEPVLRDLAARLGITGEQQRAISWCVSACDPEADHPWRDPLHEIGNAFRRVEEVGIPANAITETRWPPFRGGTDYAGLIRVCRQGACRDER